MNRSTWGGYVGLVMLLITALIIVFLLWRSDLFSEFSPVATSTSDGIMPAGRTPIEQDLNAIKAAQNARAQIEAQNRAEVQQ